MAPKAAYCERKQQDVCIIGFPFSWASTLQCSLGTQQSAGYGRQLIGVIRQVPHVLSPIPAVDCTIQMVLLAWRCDRCAYHGIILPANVSFLRL